MAKDVLNRPRGDVGKAEHTRNRRRFYPSVDIFENTEGLTVLADMPGVKTEDIDIKFENGVLTLHGKVAERQPEGTSYLRREYGLGDFYRTFEVSENIDVEHISADYKNGVLVLHLPKVEAAKPRKIAIKAK